MSGPSVYPACLVKRNRATKPEMQLRLAGLRRIVEAVRPMTVRQVFYQATVQGLVEKTERRASLRLVRIIVLSTTP
jgi:hypothetical protein